MIVDARVEIYFDKLYAYFQPIVLCFEESDDIESLEEALSSPEAIQQARNAFSDGLGIPENLLPEVSFRHGQPHEEENKIAPLIDSWLFRTSAGVVLKLRQFTFCPSPYRAVFKVEYWEETNSSVRHSGKFVVQFGSFSHFWVVMNNNTSEIIYSAIQAKFDLYGKQHTTPICIGITDDDPCDMEIPSPDNHRPDN